MGRTITLNGIKCLTYDPQTAPAAYIESGDTVIFESDDANSSLILDEHPKWTTNHDLNEAAGGGSNPLCGPVYVNGAEAGDYLSIEILKVEPGIWRNGGYTSIQEGIGWLAGTKYSIQQPISSEFRILQFDGEGKAAMNLKNGEEYIKIPLNPFVGCVGVAPKRDRVLTNTMSEEYCGNVDIPQIREGATVVLRCNVDGGLLYIGDVHAAQGDGEITDCAFECQGRTTVRISVIKREDMPYYCCPQVNTPAMLGSVGVFNMNHTMAIKRGYTDLINRIEAEYGICAADAYMLLCLCGKIQIGNGCTAICMIARDVLTKYKK